ncbi:hypothetical protein HUE56_25085 (plasmid) [Azospirillum oryzae]|uniref:Uncharacterized protein n=1 Tax=Azospirillum oryzae TaxID=286727 RepID=A0A6N1AQR8_9PROT|nr:hypothetical protein [Azospirillum oryzae]QKS53799.1 hypothetical protein HUE56_25085 [Azospirillum oryzae]GLR82592.1 hypothetical protein GCM10007856_52910 [Azospirillum oryzae]
MLKKMILHTLLTAVVVGALATAYQARAAGQQGAAGIAALLTGGLTHDAGHDD